MNHTSREYAEALFELALEEDRASEFAEGLNLVEEAILNQSRRLVAEPDAELSTLLLSDFELEEKMEA